MHSCIRVKLACSASLGLARNYLNNYFAIYTRLTCSRICVELASPGYMEFGVHLMINLIPYNRLRDFLFYVELAFPGYLGFGDNLCINLLSPACLLAFVL